jgi:hypothetical protein
LLTYQVRRRILMWEDGAANRPRFPNNGEVRFTLAPGGPFGSGELSNRLLLVGVHVSLGPELNTGRYGRSEPQYMDPISIGSQVGDVTMRAEGNVVTVSRPFKSEKELVNLIESVHFGLPVVLALKYLDAPVVVSVTGNVGGVEFVWAYVDYPWTTKTTTKELQEQEFLESWERLELIRPGQNIRLFAALHYFHIACRLAIVGITPWEFMGEILLNLSKVLEVLFPGPEGESINAARDGLSALGYEPNDIERYYIPAIALRNQLDVGHVSLVTLSSKQLRPVHNYTSQAEYYFRDLLLRAISAIVKGTLVPAPYQHQPGPAEKTIRRLSTYFPEP